MKRKKSKIIIDPEQYNGIYNHTKPELLQITLDKLKIKLKGYEEGVRHKNIFLSVLGTIVAILLVFVTADFKDSLGFSASTWQAFFILVLVVLGILLVYSVITWLRKRITIESIIDDFRKEK